MVRIIEDEEAFMAVLEEAGDKLVVVDFTATWCGPCKMIAPKYADLALQPENKNVIFLKVDVDEASDVAAKYDIKCMPTFMFFKNGERLEDFSGANIDKLVELLAKYRS